MVCWTDNERWYRALTALWAAELRADNAARRSRSPVTDVDFATTVLHLTPGARVLDLACAWGRTTLELARRGYHVTGFDFSPELLAIGWERATAAALPVAFVEGTIRCLPFSSPFAAVTAFYDDSLLSFEDVADTQAALGEVARLLRPGGGLVFGTTDCPLILAPFQRETRQVAGVQIVEEIRFDAATRTGTGLRTHHTTPGTTAVYRRVRRHWTPAEAADLLAAVGLELRRVWCAYDDDLPYGRRPEGMVLLATKHPDTPPR